MFLTEIRLPAGTVRNPYDAHRALWTFFLQNPDKGRAFLYRTDWPGHSAPACVLVQSAICPQEDDRTIGGVVRGPKEFHPHFVGGQALRFALRANPIKRLSAERCRVPLVRHEDLLAWLARKLVGAAEILDADVVGNCALYFRKRGKVGKIATVTFTGILEVTDPDRFSDTLAAGIGPAKGFGCGLLSVAPLRA